MFSHGFADRLDRVSAARFQLATAFLQWNSFHIGILNDL